MNYILKVTDGCNMRCKYCCIGDKSDFNIISEEQLYKNLCFCAENSIARNEKTANIIFHGGEPTIVPCEFYEESIKKIEEKYTDITFCWRMQSNGFHINNKFINLFSKYGFSIGVSIDGSAQIHNQTRIDINGNPTYDVIYNNILKLKSKNINVSALMVVGANVTEDFSFLDEFAEHHIPIKINPLIECGEAENNNEILLKSGQYAEYLIKVSEYIVSHELDIPIQPIDSLSEKIFSHSQYGECTFSENCFCNFIALDYKGQIYPCGRFCDNNAFSGGNININSVSLPFENQVYKPEIRSECSVCKFQKLCNGGCPFMVWINKNHKNPLCHDYKKFFKYLMTDGLIFIENKLKEKREELYNGNYR